MYGCNKINSTQDSFGSNYLCALSFVVSFGLGKFIYNQYTK